MLTPKIPFSSAESKPLCLILETVSILSINMNSTGYSSFHEFKRQASFFFKEKIKTVRLALTDVTPAELLTEEATNGNTWAPDTRTMGSISRAAFEVDDYWRILEILHKRFTKFERKNWRVLYNSLVVLDHLLTHGPESVSEEFQSDKDIIRKIESFQYIDEKGFNWGLAIRKKSERILKLLEKGPILKEERERARKLTRGIQGIGSFCRRSSEKGMLHKSSRGTFERCNCHFNSCGNEENQPPIPNQRVLVQKVENLHQLSEKAIFCSGQIAGNPSSCSNFSDREVLQNPEIQASFKENMAPNKEELHNWNFTGEIFPLLDSRNDEPGVGSLVEDDHPFNDTDNQTNVSLLDAKDGIFQGC